MKVQLLILAQAVAEAIEIEREACAKIADSYRCGACGMDGKAAAAIRARGALTAGKSGAALTDKQNP